MKLDNSLLSPIMIHVRSIWSLQNFMMRIKLKLTKRVRDCFKVIDKSKSISVRDHVKQEIETIPLNSEHCFVPEISLLLITQIFSKLFHEIFCDDYRLKFQTCLKLVWRVQTTLTRSVGKINPKLTSEKSCLSFVSRVAGRQLRT